MTTTLPGQRGQGRAAAYWKAFGVDAVCSGQDIGSNQGTFISPGLCRQMLLPGWRAQCDAYHAEGMPWLLARVRKQPCHLGPV